MAAVPPAVLQAAASLRAPVIGLISGSARAESLNSKLLKAAEQLLKSKAGHGSEVKILDLPSYDLPLYTQLAEKAGFPEGAVKLKKDLESCDGLILASPEFNGFPTALLINAITWASRGDPRGGGLYKSFKGKVAVVVAASPGAMGGFRCISIHRQLLQNLGVTVLPESLALGGAFKAFNEEDGSIKDEGQARRLQAAVGQLIHYSRSNANRSATCGIMKAVMSQTTLAAYGAVDTPV